jgi:hypothetical protein
MKLQNGSKDAKREDGIAMKDLPHYWRATGRRRPYTDVGIKRVLCVRCGDPAHAQWQVCADQGFYRALCKPCDLALNELVLAWANDPDRHLKMEWYRAKQGA